MAIIGTAEQVAAYKALPRYTKPNEYIVERPGWNGAIRLQDGTKNGMLVVMEWVRIPATTEYWPMPEHYDYHWHNSIPLTKAGTVAKAQIERRVPTNLHEVFRAALQAYKQHDKADPEFVYIF